MATERGKGPEFLEDRARRAYNRDVMQRYVVMDVPVGAVVLVAGPKGLTNVVVTSRRGREAERMAKARFVGVTSDPSLLPDLQAELEAYFAGQEVSFDTPVDLTGVTVFQRRVLQACRRIAYGRVATYGELARCVGRPKAARAVGQAMAANPVPIVIPCHRVVGASGELTGFSAEQGVGLKRWLLELEFGARSLGCRNVGGPVWRR
ncbi:MAG TPA: methylated-DNA--[protein]-cysteine S-methyltransferase [Phycisphaerae bacterium]|nr:methylated-DNA--[protein]-cysteine S-methyltransferase [Phycisphaerae bacterium]HRY70602.1 methylated-DNA--[protein]-cysteine S-methyltransferase [Phycisphaerae bacterium]